METKTTTKMVRKITDLAGFSEQYAHAQRFGADIVHSNGGLTVATDKLTGKQLWRCIDLREWERNERHVALSIGRISHVVVVATLLYVHNEDESRDVRVREKSEMILLQLEARDRELFRGFDFNRHDIDATARVAEAHEEIYAEVTRRLGDK